MANRRAHVGGIDRAEVMRQAHRTHRYAISKGWDDWPFSRCLRFALAEARGRRELHGFVAVEEAMQRMLVAYSCDAPTAFPLRS